MILLGLEWVGTVMCLLSGFRIAGKHIDGFYVSVIANAILGSYGFLTDQYGILMLCVVYAVISCWGIYNWRKEDAIHKTRR